MKSSHFYISIGLATLCLLLSLTVILLGRSSQKLSAELRKQEAQLQNQQAAINQGNVIIQQVGPNILRDMASASLEDQPMKDLLTKHGYTINVATPAPETK